MQSSPTKPKLPPTLPPELLLQIFKHLPPNHLARVSLVSHLWSRLTSDDTLWTPHCHSLGLHHPLPIHTPLKTLPPKHQYISTYKTYKNYLDIYPTIAEYSSRLHTYLQTHSPKTRESINAPLDWKTEDQLVIDDGVWRFDGWEYDTRLHDHYGRELVLFWRLFGDGQGYGPFALFGNYRCYDDESHLCFLESNYVREMHRRRTNFGILPFAYCPRTVRMLGIVIDCPAKVKDKLLHTVVQTGRTMRSYIPHGSFLTFLQNYTTSLETSLFETSLLHLPPPISSISAYPTRGPGTSTLTTSGLRIDISSLPTLEYSGSELVYTYQIRMTYVGPCTFKWVKLAMRKWVIGYASGNQEVVQGAGVVGLYPVLGESKPEFKYSSYCTDSIYDPVVGMSGELTFVAVDGDGEHMDERKPIEVDGPARVLVVPVPEVVFVRPALL